MKLKKVMVLLLCGILLAGCGAKGKDDAISNLTQNDLTKNESVNKDAEKNAESVDGSRSENNGTVESAGADAADTGNVSGNNEGTNATGNSTENDVTDTDGNTSAEAADSDADVQEPYILTFEANTINGETWNSDKITESKLTMINVWATYCNPCLSEMPDLGEIAAEYDSAEFQLIGIISDVMEGDGEDIIAEAKYLIEETKANYPHLVLNESLYSNLVGAVRAVPTTFFVNQDNELLGYVTGAQAKETWVSLIEQLLGEME